MLKKLLKILIIIIFCLLIFSKFNFAFAFAPKIVNKLNSSFNDIEKWCIKLATPAAAVSFAIGLFIKKFSFGDEERVRTAKKLIRGTIIAYALIISTKLILNFILVVLK